MLKSGHRAESLNTLGVQNGQPREEFEHAGWVFKTSNRDERWKGADSAELLRAAVELAREAGYSVVNVDVVIATEGPRIGPHRAAMRARMADLLGVSADAVNVKGKSLEGMGALAGGAGVAVQAVCLLQGS